MTCMISEKNDLSCIFFDYEYDTVIMYVTCMLVYYGVIPLSLRLIPRKKFSRLSVAVLQVLRASHLDILADISDPLVLSTFALNRPFEEYPVTCMT